MEEIIEVVRSNLWEFVRRTVAEVVTVPVHRRIVEQTGKLLRPEIVEEVLNVVRTSQERSRHVVEHIMDEIIAGVQSNPQGCVQRNVQQVVDVLVRQIQEQILQVGNVISQERFSERMVEQGVDNHVHQSTE